MRHASKILLLIAALPVLTASSCTQTPPAPTAQGWSADQRNSWYSASQGSRLIPRAWLDALEQPDAAAPFLAPAYLAHFRYTDAALAPRTGIDRACPVDPALPLGFTVDCQDDSKFGVTRLSWRAQPGSTEPWVGLNCSACHTNAIVLHYSDNKPNPDETLVVDGAPTLADFQGFMAALETALENTAGDPAKFARFTATLRHNGAAADPATLKTALASLIGWNRALAALNADAATPYGYGRLDAIGHIFNKVALAGLPPAAGTQTSNPSDAPVSYPFLWNVPQLDKVEWNGIADNTPTRFIGTVDFGALGRNTGEVTGVFADLTVTPRAGSAGYVSSARLDRLDEMEQQLRALRPPVWPARLGLNTALIPAGARLFADHCAACHTVPQAQGDLTQKFTVTLTALSETGTDIWMACNASFDMARAGAFAGSRQNMIAGDTLADPSFNLALVQNAVVGSIIGQKGVLVETTLAGLFGFDNGLPPPLHRLGAAAHAVIPPKQARENTCRAAMANPADPHHAQLVYKARSLQGIWATAPYLHNGSVPTLFDLLLPPAQRPVTFAVGSHVFDPVKIGFDTGAGPYTFLFDTRLPGNSNAGHDYGNAGFTAADRAALLEYMKTL